MTSEVIAVYEGENGVRVEVRDLTAPYAYKNIHHVRLEVCATFADCGEKFCRTLEKMGVFEEDLASAKEELLASFRETVLPYLRREDFARRLFEARCREEVKAFGYGEGR